MQLDQLTKSNTVLKM